jgi:hypothetical protein
MTLPDDADIALGENDEKKDKKKGKGKNKNKRRLAGEPLSVLVVRVGSTSDGRSTPASESKLANDIFDDSVSLATHYNACSYGLVQFAKATGNNVNNGVVTVSLTSSVNGVESSTVRTRMQDAATARIGQDVRNAYDHVMFCIPPGTVDDGSADW